MIEFVRRIRAGTDKTALVLCNGGYVSYHHVVILAAKPNGLAYPTASFLPKELTAPLPPKLVENCPTTPTPVYIESYTMEYARDNTPNRSMFILRFNSPDRERTLANGRDKAVIEAILQAHKSGKEVVGMRGYVVGQGKKNLFYFAEERAKM